AVSMAALDNLESLRVKTPQDATAALAQAVESADFRAVTGPGANSLPKLQKRIEIVGQAFRYHMANLAEFLSHQLTEDLKWREEELAVMRKQLYLAKEGGLQERVLLRAGVAMLYAHYEGYCKFAIELYLDSLRKLKLPRKEFVWKLA